MFSHCVALRAIVVVLTLSVGAAMGDDTPPSLGAASAIREADADGGSTADALAAGHQLERMYRTMDFVGVIDFNLTMEGVERQPNSTVKQRGRLYVGRNGAMRLDLWIPATTAHPIVCGIANGKAWMIGGDRAIVLVADYPMDVDSEQTYAYLLQTQVAQTEYYAGRVLFGSPVLSELSQRPLQSARLFGDNLYLEIGPLSGEEWGWRWYGASEVQDCGVRRAVPSGVCGDTIQYDEARGVYQARRRALRAGQE